MTSAAHIIGVIFLAICFLAAAESHGVTRFFKHSGDLGDVIYALPTIRAFGGGVLCLAQAPFTRQRLTPQYFTPLVPLLKAQDYVENVIPYNPKDHRGAIDLDASRVYRKEYARVGSDAHPTLADSCLRMFGFTIAWRDRAWLAVPRDAALDVDPDVTGVRPGFFAEPFVVFARSARYHNRKFPWPAAWGRYHRRAVFVGTPGEHHAFCAGIGDVPYVPTKDFLQLAMLIQRSALFVGNQSAPFAVAEGLKHPVIQETCPEVRDCIYARENALHGLDDDIITKLPEVA